MEVAKIISPMQPDYEQVDQLAVVGAQILQGLRPGKPAAGK